MRLAHTHAAARQAQQPDGPPGSDAAQTDAYYPDSRVASHRSWVSPLSTRDGAPRPVPNDALMLPRGGESPWIVPAQSDEQGLGRSPGQQWPWQVVSEAYNFDTLAIMPMEWEQTGDPAGGIPGWYGRNPPERPAVFAYQTGGKPYYEQTEGYVTSDMDQVAVTADPQQAAYTIGWGTLDAPGSPPIDDGGYGYE